MHQGNTATKQLKDKDETTTVMVHARNINETKTLCIPTEKEWIQDTSEDHNLEYINNILSGTEDTPVQTKYPRNKDMSNYFSKDV